MNLQELQHILLPVTSDVYTFDKQITVLVKTPEEFFTTQAILEQAAYVNAYKKSMQRIEHLQEFTIDDEFKKVIEFFEDKEAALQDYQTPLIEYLIRYPKIVAKNFFGVREVFTKEQSFVYIIKLYSLKFYILDEYVFIDDYGFDKVTKYFLGKQIDFPGELNKDSFVSFIHEKNIHVIYELLTLIPFTQNEFDQVFEAYQKDEEKYKGHENLIKDVETKLVLSRLLKEKLEIAKQNNTGIFSLNILSDEEINNRLGLIMKYMHAYIQQMMTLDDETKSLLVQNDIDIAINRELMQIKSYIKANDPLKQKIEETIIALDDVKMTKDLQDNKQRVLFLHEYLTSIQELLTQL